MFNNYLSVKETSGIHTLRIQKREWILSLLLTYADINNNLDLFFSYEMPEDLREWIKLKTKKINWMHEKEDSIYSNKVKFRIYKKWLYLNYKKRLKKVLKFMYSPVFISFLLMRYGVIDKKQICIESDLLKNKEDILLLKKWFEEIFQIDSTIKNNKLIFDIKNSKRILDSCESTIKQIKSMYIKFYTGGLIDGQSCTTQRKSLNR